MKKLDCCLMISLLAACGSDLADKGEEDTPLTDGKADSFGAPTEHGELVFGVEQEARIGSGERFHAWDFVLTNEAQVDLRTIVNSLDTVMYVYKRKDDGGWGRYIRKNDDDGDSVASRIVLDGEAGSYRVIVKSFHDTASGDFALLGTCEGAGCSLTCEAPSIPESTFWDLDCAYEVTSILNGHWVSATGATVGRADRCDEVDSMERTALDYYWRQYPESDRVRFDVEDRRNGHIFTVGPEAVKMVFNLNSELVAVLDSESGFTDYHCGSFDEPAADRPSPDCLQNMMSALPHPAHTESGFQAVDLAIDEVDGAHPGVAHAVRQFAVNVGAADDEVVTAEFITWTSDDGTETAEVNVIGQENSGQFTVFDDGTTWRTLFVTDVNGIFMVCE